jgi:hypothetical protein
VYLRSLTSLPDNAQFNNGGSVDLRSLTSLPDNAQFNNGGNVDLRSQQIKIKTSYLKRFKVKIKKGNIILYKKVSKDFKTQEGTINETLWKIGNIVKHPNWNPLSSECGEGKFHACIKPFWCDSFRNVKGDKYIAIKVNVKDLYEWTNSPSYPQKIGFRKGKVIKEVTRTEQVIY